MSPICPIILAGGQGNRLWPLSTPERPKQFLRLPGQPSLFQQTLLRVKELEFLPPIIVCNKNHKDLVQQELLESNTHPTAIILEPESKNTAVAIALASTWINEHIHQQAQCLILPADQLLEPANKLIDAVRTAIDKAPNSLNLFGITPQSPSSQFGYIKTNNYGEVIGFEEKPDNEKAKQLLQQNNSYWNSGWFLAKNSNLQSWLSKWQPQIHKQTNQAIKHAESKEGLIAPEAKALNNLPPLPFDKAIVEHGPNTTMPIHHTPLDCTWRDMGSWQAWHELALYQEPRASTNRHWGSYKILAEQAGYKVKLLTLSANASISYQKHRHRTEHWVIMSGRAEVRLDDTKRSLQIGDEITVNPNQWHQLFNTGDTELTVIETQIGDYLEEDDIIRL